MQVVEQFLHAAESLQLASMGLLHRLNGDRSGNQWCERKSLLDRRLGSTRIRAMTLEGADLRLSLEISVMQPNALGPHADLEFADRLWVESILALLWGLLHLRAIAELQLCGIWLPGRQAIPHAITDTPTQTRIHPGPYGEPSQLGAA